MNEEMRKVRDEEAEEFQAFIMKNFSSYSFARAYIAGWDAATKNMEMCPNEEWECKKIQRQFESQLKQKDEMLAVARDGLNEVAKRHGMCMMGPRDDVCAEIYEKNDGFDCYRRAFELGSFNAYSECVSDAQETLAKLDEMAGENAAELTKTVTQTHTGKDGIGWDPRGIDDDPSKDTWRK